jgi:hypothetical protein
MITIYWDKENMRRTLKICIELYRFLLPFATKKALHLWRALWRGVFLCGAVGQKLPPKTLA